MGQTVLSIDRKTLHTSQPLCLSELISHYLPPRSLRFSNTNLLTRPAGITSNFSSRAFSVSAPSIWNFLPARVRSIDTLSTFKRHLKFHLFQSSHPVPAPQIRSHEFWCYINLYVYVCMYVCQTDGQTDARPLHRPFTTCYAASATKRSEPDMELGHWVTGSMRHLGHLSRPGHRVIILTQCETRVFPVFEKNAQNAKRAFEMLK